MLDMWEYIHFHCSFHICLSVSFERSIECDLLQNSLQDQLIENAAYDCWFHDTETTVNVLK